MNYLQIISRKPVYRAGSAAEADALFRTHVEQFTSEGNGLSERREMVELATSFWSRARRAFLAALAVFETAAAAAAIAALVLLIACANIANLLLARGRRERGISVYGWRLGRAAPA